jgi:hypothetical protein
MPCQERVGFDDGGNFFEGLFAQFLADLGQSLALGIGERYTPFNLFAQNTIFFDQVFVAQQELLFD